MIINLNENIIKKLTKTESEKGNTCGKQRFL